MAQRPTFPSPFLQAIDATKDNDFLCLINDKDIIKSYTFTLISIEKSTSGAETFTEIYKKTESTTIYGGKGNDSYLIITVPSKDSTETDSSWKNKSKWDNDKEYKWKVSLTDSYDKVVESREYYFSTVKEPTIRFYLLNNGVKERSISGYNNSIPKANQSFLCEYECNSPMVYYRFVLTKDGVTIKDTGEIRSQYITFDYDMFFNGNYELTVQIENEGKVKAEKSIGFKVTYTNAPTVITPECSVCDDNSVLIDLSNLMSINGKITYPTYEPYQYGYTGIYKTDSGYQFCSLIEGQSLSWQEKLGVSDNLDIDEDNFTLYLLIHLPLNNKQAKILEITGDNTISITWNGFEFAYLYSTGVSGTVKICESNSYVFGNILTSETIDADKLYKYDFGTSNIYNFTSDYKFVFQTPINIYWYCLKIVPTGVDIQKGGKFE